MNQTSLREQFLHCMERKKAEKEKKEKPVDSIEISETTKEPVAPEPEQEPEQEAPRKPVRKRRKKVVLDDDDD